MAAAAAAAADETFKNQEAMVVQPTSTYQGSGQGSSASSQEAQTQLKALVDEHVVPHGRRILDRVKPWSTFTSGLSLQPKAPEDRLTHIRSNLNHFKANYAVVFGGMLLIGILQDFTYVFALGAVASAWFMFFKKNMGDPSWRPVVFGREVTAQQRWSILSGGSLLLLLIVSWNMLLFVACLSGIVAVTHAALHPGPEAVADDAQLFNGDHPRALEEGSVASPVVVGVPATADGRPEGSPEVVVGMPVQQLPSFRGPPAADTDDCAK